MRSSAALIAIAAAAVGVLVCIEAPAALWIVLTDGLLAAGIIALATVPGMRLLRLVAGRIDGAEAASHCRVGSEDAGFSNGAAHRQAARSQATAAVKDRPGAEPLACRIIFAAGLGVGLLCLLEFTLGVCGALQRAWWIVVFGGAVLLSLAANALTVRRLIVSGASFHFPGIGRGHWLWLAVVPFAALALIVATAPPGVLWPAEGNGYDVLEYHLAVPKQYYEAGRIFFLANNAYSNFPFNAEMLYLLAMVLRGGPIEGIMLAQMFNAAMAFLFVAAIWAAARPFGSPAALVAAVAAGTCGWLVYLSGVAYVENAMLLFTALAFAAWVRWAFFVPCLPEGRAGGATGAASPAHGESWALLAGLFVGLACGCKYTAGPLVAVPLGLGLAAAGGRRSVSNRVGPFSPDRVDLAPPASRRERGGLLRSLALYVLGIVVSFAPWLLKNAVFCGNPVFPQATAALGYRPGIWNPECEHRWARGHLPAPELRSPAGRLRATWQAVVAEPLVGPAIWLLAVWGFGVHAKRAWPLGAIILVQIILWVALTHLAGRFAVPVIPPLVLLAATVAGGKPSTTGSPRRSQPAWQDARPPGRAAGCIPPLVYAVVLLGAGANLYHVGGLYYDRTRFRTVDGRVEKIAWPGQVQWFTEGQWPGTAHLGFINRELPANAKVRLVADARSLYVLRACDYCVVFNPDPLAAAVRESGDAAGVLDRLRRSGWTHLYVDWLEMRRLRATYGFPPEIREELFVRLEKVGLRRIKDFALDDRERPYGTIYEVCP